MHPIKNYRTQHKLTQEELARIIGVHSITVSRWETGERKTGRDLLPVIERELGIAPAEIFEFERAAE